MAVVREFHARVAVVGLVKTEKKEDVLHTLYNRTSYLQLPSLNLHSFTSYSPSSPSSSAIFPLIPFLY